MEDFEQRRKDLELSGKKSIQIKLLLKDCFDKDEFECRLDLKEYLKDNQYVYHQGWELKAEEFAYRVSNVHVPVEYLDNYVYLLLLRENCEAWLRIWSNYCDDIETFNSGLPGGSYEFSTEEIKLKWEEMKQGEAFEEMEVRILTNKLLK